MRENYRKQLESLSRELIAMGSLCESAIDMCIKVISRSQAVGDDIKVLEGEINSKERELENLCIKILLQQQPVASDLRFISAALKMVTDLERIGDNAADIAEVAAYIGQLGEGERKVFSNLSDSVRQIVRNAIDAFVRRDAELAKETIEYDNVVDALFVKVKHLVIESIDRENADGESIIDLLMCAKYFERIGDHAVNVARWAIFAK